MNKHKILYIIPIIAIALFSVAFISTFQAQAQTENEDRRFFQKDTCATEIALISDMRYTNGEEISFSTGGCIVVNQTIERWSEISVSDRLIITNRLAIQGYEDVTESMSEILRGNGQ